MDWLLERYEREILNVASFLQLLQLLRFLASRYQGYAESTPGNLHQGQSSDRSRLLNDQDQRSTEQNNNTVWPEYSLFLHLDYLTNYIFNPSKGVVV